MDFKVLCLLEDSQPYIQAYMEYLKANSKDNIEYMTLPIAPATLEKTPLPTVLNALKKKFGNPEKDIDFILSFKDYYRHIKPGTLPQTPIIEMGNYAGGPNYFSRPFMNPKKVCAWEDSVLKIEPEWYNQVHPIDRKMIFRMRDSYRYAYLRKLVDEYKSKNGKNPGQDAVIYIPDWTAHLDSVLNSVYFCLDFCNQQECALYIALSKHLLDENDDFYTKNFGVKRETLNAALKILKTELNKHAEHNQESPVTIIPTEEAMSVLTTLNPKAILVDPSSTTWLESLYLIKYKGLDCNKIRLVITIEKKYPQIESKMYDKYLGDTEKFCKENLFRRDTHSLLGNISTTTDRFYHFIGYQDTPLELLDFKKLGAMFPKKPEKPEAKK